MKVQAKYVLTKNSITESYSESVILTYYTKSEIFDIEIKRTVELYSEPGSCINEYISKEELFQKINRSKDMKTYIKEFIQRHLDYLDETDKEQTIIDSLSGFTIECEIEEQDVNRLFENN